MVGAWGSWFSWQNTLVRASPLLLTGLCMALPAQIGLVVIGGEGAFVLGGLAAVAAGLPLAAMGVNWLLVQLAMAVAGIAAGGALIAFCGGLRQFRGVNETISSLLLAYIAIAVMNQLVEGPMRDPASLNSPSTRTLPDAVMLGNIPGISVHVGLLLGIAACIAAWFVVYHTRFGFAARIVGGNARAARMAGLPVGRLVMGSASSAAPPPGSAAWSKSRPCRARPTLDLATGVRLHWHSRRLPRPPEPARAHPGLHAARRLDAGERLAPAPPRPARRDDARAARGSFHDAARLGSLAGADQAAAPGSGAARRRSGRRMRKDE